MERLTSVVALVCVLSMPLATDGLPSIRSKFAKRMSAPEAQMAPLKGVHAGHRANFVTLIAPREGPGGHAKPSVLVDESHGEHAKTMQYSSVSVRQLKLLRDNQHRHKLARNFSTHFTSLRDCAGSEYVGPIGIGTKPLPEQCGGQSSSMLSAVAKGEGDENDKDDACRVREESLLSVVYDTGSTNLWMASDLCGYPCNENGRHRYNHTISTSYRQPDTPTTLNIDFGTANLQGPMGIEDFHIGPFTIKEQHFGLIEQENGETFASLPLEGIVGLAFPAMSAKGRVPFFDNVIKQKALAHNEFAFYFSQDSKGGNALFWGGVDSQLHEGDIHMFPVTQPYYWALDLIDFRIGDEPLKITEEGAAASLADEVVTGTQRLMHLLKTDTDVDGDEDKPSDVPPSTSPKLIVDTGTTYFTASGELYRRIRDKLPDAKCSTTVTYPDLVYIVKDVEGKPQELRVPASEYMVSDFGDSCTAAFMELAVSKRFGPALLLGEVFMRGFFTVFDRADGDPANAQIGFARAKHSDGLNTMLAQNPSQFHEKKQTETSVKVALDEARSPISRIAESIARYLVK